MLVLDFMLRQEPSNSREMQAKAWTKYWNKVSDGRCTGNTNVPYILESRCHLLETVKRKIFQNVFKLEMFREIYRKF